MAEAALLLEARRLSKHFGGVSAVQDVDLHVRRGEHIALVGDNGAGKSTLIKMLSGALRPDGGEIWFEEERQQFESPSDARRIGIETVYQNLALADHLDVTANLFLGREACRLRLGAFSLLAHGMMRRKARELLARTGVNIPNLGDSLLNLSGGQRQSIAIARAVGWGSRLVIMDEPTAALGIRETEHVEQIIRSLKQREMAVIIVSHNLRQVFDLADTIWVMRRGRVAGRRDRSAATPEDIVRLITGADAVGML